MTPELPTQLWLEITSSGATYIHDDEEMARTNLSEMARHGFVGQLFTASVTWVASVESEK